jgi:SAM-dependent methyltransferase
MPSGVARNAEGVRWDHLFIVDVIPPGARVLDLGCGKGILLKMLIDAKKVRGTGIEMVEDKVYEAVTKGVTVYHGDFDEGLSYYPDNSFDYVILSQTLQEARETVAVLHEAPPVHPGAGDTDREALLRGSQAASPLLAEPAFRLRGLRPRESAPRAGRCAPGCGVAQRRVGDRAAAVKWGAIRGP